MKHSLLVILVILGSRYCEAQVMSDDCLWFGFGIGISGAKRTGMLHAPMNVTYLRHNQWGINLRREWNHRGTSSGEDVNVLSHYVGFSVSGCYNLLAFSRHKIICKARISKGDGKYFKGFANSTDDPKIAVFDDFTSYGLFLSIELMLTGFRSGVSIEPFVNLNRRSYAGFAFKVNFGVMRNY